MSTRFSTLLLLLCIVILLTNCTPNNKNINEALVNIKALYETNEAEITQGVSVNNNGDKESFITVNIEKSRLINDSTYDITNALSGAALVLYDHLDEQEKSIYNYIEVDIKRDAPHEDFFTIRFPIEEMKLISESLSIVDSFYSLYTKKKYDEALLLFNVKINTELVKSELYKMDSLYGNIQSYNIKGFCKKEIEINNQKQLVLNIKTVCKRNNANTQLNFDVQYTESEQKISGIIF